MKELPTPTLPLAEAIAPMRRRPSAPTAGIPPALPATAETPAGFKVYWARHADDVRDAQRLRHQVFAGELGAALSPWPGQAPDLDIDRFDAYCEHLIVRANPDAEGQAPVIGTYRVLTPGAARRAGGYYSDTEFDLSALAPLRPTLAELGRSCTHPDHRTGPVILALWSALARFMDDNGLEAMVGCASVSMRDGGHTAASLWQQLSQDHLSEPALRVQPRLPLPVEQLDRHLPAEAPALIKGYLRCGAKLLGAPAWDPDFHTADLPMLMRLADLPRRYRQHFLGR